MKHIRKYMATLAAAGFVMAVSVPSHAAFTSKGAATPITASATTGGSPTIQITSVAIKNRSDNGTVAQIGWSGATPGAGWLVADQYIQMVSNINVLDGGIQIYTDNTNAVGVSKFTGSVSTFTATPAGLVNNSDGTNKLPTAWRASTFTVTTVNPVNPNANAGESFLWFFHLDKAQVRVPSLNSTGFHNGDAFVTVYASPGTPLTSTTLDASGNEVTTVVPTTSINSGLHFAQGPQQFGGFSSVATTDIYTEADFSGALAQVTYSTTKLILEAFSL